MKFRVLFVLVLVLANHCIAQQHSKFKLPPKATATDYLPRTLIFQVKESIRSQALTSKIESPAIQEVLNKHGIFSFGKKFPHSPSPATRTDRRGRKLADLSLIYEWEYNSNVGLEEVINELLATNLLVYAEPNYINHLTYTPNDTAIGSNVGTWWYEVNKAFQAWDIQKGDTNIVIGITDTGTDLIHEDLSGNTKRNYADPIDGVDNDNDGYIDNFNGWDMGQNDNDPTVGGVHHGVHVAGLCSAVPDNIVGMAGSGFNCKFLPIKITNANDAITRGYEGVVYAAEHGCRIINCSWGSFFPSISGQQVIDYVTLNKNSLVVGGCGNENEETDFYPASCRYVMSIASHSNLSQKSPFSNFSYNVDVVGPGQMVMSTWPWPEDSYLVSNGTSMSSPVVAGTAGLVLAQFPWMDALQLGEQIKATADLLDTVPGNEVYANRLGKGRLNMYRAVSTPLAKSAELELDTVFDMNDGSLQALDTVNLNFTALNYLAPLSNATITLSIASPFATLISGNALVGDMDTYSSFSNASPFQFRVEAGVPINCEIVLDFTISDGNWNTHVYRPIKVNKDYLNIVENEVWTSVTSSSNWGYSSSNEGLGFQFEGENLLFEGGFFCGKDTVYVSDNLRSSSGGQNHDFALLQRIAQTPAAQTNAAFESVSFCADTAASSPLPVKVSQRSRAYSQPGHTRYVMFDYTIHNTGNAPITNFYSGIFTDWDILNYNANRADQIVDKKLGYGFCSEDITLYAGVKVLSNGNFFHYAMDNLSGGNGGVNLFDGFTKLEKYTTLSNSRPQAGQNGTGNDIANVVSTGPYAIPPGDSIQLSFAILAGETLEDLAKSADSAQARYTANILHTDLSSAMGKCSTHCLVFPNPVGEELNFNTCTSLGGHYYIVIASPDGRQISRQYIIADKNEQVKVNTQSLSKGIYILTVQSSQNNCRVKFVKGN